MTTCDIKAISDQFSTGVVTMFSLCRAESTAKREISREAYGVQTGG